MPAKQPSWARVAGLLAACIATLIGVWYRIDPEEILLRATVAAVVIAFITNLMCQLVASLGNQRSSQ